MKISLSIILLFFTFSACKKSSDTLPVTPEMNITINGIPTKFTPYYAAIKPNVSNPAARDFQLFTKSPDSKDHFMITIQAPGNFTTGTYQVNNPGHLVIVDYTINTAQATEKAYTTDPAPAQPPPQFTVTITYFDDEVIKGHFSGNYLYDAAHNESILITSGSFVAKRHG
jgi:hypothetical protein